MANSCPHDPRETFGAVGMYHCPECGEMVISGMEHPDWSTLDDATDSGIAPDQRIPPAGAARKDAH